LLTKAPNRNSQLLYISVYIVLCVYVSNGFLNSNILFPHLGCHTSKIWCYW